MISTTIHSIVTLSHAVQKLNQHYRMVIGVYTLLYGQ